MLVTKSPAEPCAEADRGLGIEVKRLGGELPGERPDLPRVDPVRAAHKPLPDPKVFEVEGRCPAAWIPFAMMGRSCEVAVRGIVTARANRHAAPRSHGRWSPVCRPRNRLWSRSHTSPGIPSEP